MVTSNIKLVEEVVDIDVGVAAGDGMQHRHRQGCIG